jgi:chromate reductase
MSNTIQLLGFSGSLRKGSFNTGLLRAATELLPQDVSLDMFDLLPIPLYNGDVEDEGMPQAVQQLREKIAAADGVVIACPEYNHSVTGVLKNAIDWISRPPNQPLSGKPVALMGGGGGFGSVRAQVHLRYLLVNLNTMQLNKPEVLVPNIASKFDDQGRLTDEETRKRIGEMLEAFADLIRSHK